MKAVLPILLIIAGLVFAYLAVTTFQGASADVKVLGLEIGATDEGAQTTALLYGALSVACFVGGAFTFGKK